jgi:hypothetical protein
MSQKKTGTKQREKGGKQWAIKNQIKKGKKTLSQKGEKGQEKNLTKRQ